MALLGGLIGGGAGALLGAATVQLSADTRPLVAGLEKGKAETAAASGSMTKSVGGFSKAALAAYAVAGIAVVKFAVDAVKAAEESQRVQAQTAAVIRSTGSAAGFTAQQIANLAAAFQKTTTYSDEEVQSAENLLLTFTRIGHDIFPTATQAVLDMSTALGQDLKSSSIQLGKALNDPIAGLTALRRVGVAFDAQQREQIKTLVESGKTLEAQKIILAEVAREFGGSASAAASTFEGHMKQLANQFDDFKERVGRVVIVLLNALLPVLSGILSVIGKLLPEIVAFGAAFLAWKALSFIPGLLLSIAAGLESIGAANLASGILSVGVALEGVGTAVAEAAPLLAIPGAFFALGAIEARANAKALDEARATIVKFGTDSEQSAASVSQLSRAIAQQHGAGRLGITNEERTAAAADIKAQLDGLAAQHAAQQIAQQDLQSFTQSLGPFHSAIASIASASGQSFGDFETSLKTALSAGQADEKAWATFTQDTMNKAAESFQTFNDSAAQSVSFMGTALSDLTNNTKATASQILAAFNKATAATKAFGANLLVIAHTGGQAGKDLAAQLLALGPAAAGTAATIANSSAEMRDKIVAAFGKGQDAAQSLADRLQKAIVGTLKDIRALLEAIAKHWNVDVAVNVSGHGSGLSGAGPVTVNLPGAPQGKHYVAAGGIISGATGFVTAGPTYLVGEGGYNTFAGKGAEAVIPLNSRGLGILTEALRRSQPKQERWHRGTTVNNVVTVNVAGTVISERDLAQRIRTELVKTGTRNGGVTGL
jgi:hypothetical protein